MDSILGCDFSDPRLVLSKGVAQCESFGRPSWITKCVTLINELGMDVAQGICHSVKADLVIDSNDMPLGNDCVAVQIAKLLVEDKLPSEWMFSIRAWHICRMFLNRASLHDHDQRHFYKAEVQNCIQPFLCAKIHTLKSLFFQKGRQYFKSHCLLDVHRQIHHDSDGNEMIILEGCIVYPMAWYTIMDVLRAITTGGRLMPTSECVLISKAMLG